jgi:hypothetical protein
LRIQLTEDSGKEKAPASKRPGLFNLGRATCLRAAGALRTAAGTAGTEVHIAVEFEAVHMKINLDGFGFLHELFVHDVLVAVYVESVVVVVRLIQSHGQTGATSPAFVEKDADRLHLFAFEILGNLLSGRFSYFQHDVPPW